MKVGFSELFHALTLLCVCSRIKQDGSFPRPSSASRPPLDPGLDVSISPQSPAVSAAASRQERERDHDLSLQRIEPERDDPETRGQHRLSEDCFPSSHAGGGGPGQRQSGVKDQEGDKDVGVMESTGDSTTVWSSVELDVNYTHSHQGEREIHISLLTY